LKFGLLGKEASKCPSPSTQSSLEQQLRMPRKDPSLRLIDGRTTRHSKDSAEEQQQQKKSYQNKLKNPLKTRPFVYCPQSQLPGSHSLSFLITPKAFFLETKRNPLSTIFHKMPLFAIKNIPSSLVSRSYNYYLRFHAARIFICTRRVWCW
jgi:hypothetical protein